MYINQYVHILPRTLEKIGFSLSSSLSFPNLFLFPSSCIRDILVIGEGCALVLKQIHSSGHLVRYIKTRQTLQDCCSSDCVLGDSPLYPLVNVTVWWLWVRFKARQFGIGGGQRIVIAVSLTRVFPPSRPGTDMCSCPDAVGPRAPNSEYRWGVNNLLQNVWCTISSSHIKLFC